MYFQLPLSNNNITSMHSLTYWMKRLQDIGQYHYITPWFFLKIVYLIHGALDTPVNSWFFFSFSSSEVLYFNTLIRQTHFTDLAKSDFFFHIIRSKYVGPLIECSLNLLDMISFDAFINLCIEYMKVNLQWRVQQLGHNHCTQVSLPPPDTSTR